MLATDYCDVSFFDIPLWEGDILYPDGTRINRVFDTSIWADCCESGIPMVDMCGEAKTIEWTHIYMEGFR